MPPHLGGIGLGRGTVAVGGALAIAVLVAYLSITQIDIPRSTELAVPGADEPRPDRPLLDNA
jgi:hypothetical protein